MTIAFSILTVALIVSVVANVLQANRMATCRVEIDEQRIEASYQADKHRQEAEELRRHLAARDREFGNWQNCMRASGA